MCSLDKSLEQSGIQARSRLAGLAGLVGLLTCKLCWVDIDESKSLTLFPEPQVDLYENIDKYLKAGREGFESYFTGQMLCIVALICWYLMVAKEAGGEHLLETVARATIPSFDHL